MERGNPITNFWEVKYLLANFSLVLLNYQCMYRRNVSVNVLIRQRSGLVDQLSSLTEYALYT
jgi:hypothetical protein